METNPLQLPMNDLERYFHNNPGRQMLKWHHYFEIYDRHFSKFRGKKMCILEIGVSQGGSLQMWREYFGPESTVVGVDCDARCKALEEHGIAVEIGDQADRAFLGRLRQKYPTIDIVVDDGGHRVEQQITSFEELYWHISPDGVYLCEDLHTNYWRGYGGGLGKPNTFVEHCKRLTDHLTFWHCEDHRLQTMTEFTKSTWSMHFYNSVIAIEKRRNVTPNQTATGNRMF